MRVRDVVVDISRESTVVLTPEGEFRALPWQGHLSIGQEVVLPAKKAPLSFLCKGPAVLTALIMAIFLVLLLSEHAGANSPGSIKVHLFTSPGPLEVGARGGFTLLDLESGRALGTYAGSARLTLVWQGGFVVLPDGRRLEAVRIVPTETGADNLLTLDGKAYRGELAIRSLPEALDVVNVVDMEDYLRGVVPLEMSPGWPVEALKAQAVAARTFAYRNMGRHAAEGFDLCAAAHCQVYGGAGVETEATDRAVNETTALVMRYSGELIDAYYHASSGGHTEAAGAVWGSDRPYLQGVADAWDLVSPYAEWEVSFSPEELGTLLSKAGFAVGRVEEIQPSERTDSGRAVSFLVRGSAGSQIIPANALRLAVGPTRMKSTWVEPVVDSGWPAWPVSTGRVVVTVQGAYGQAMRSVQVGVAVATAEGIKVLPDRSGSRIVSRGEQTDRIVLRGRGYGHGVGMSQWGAKGLAENHPDEDPEFFRQILTHYYTGVTIEPY